jgi:hypothetical protein
MTAASVAIAAPASDDFRRSQHAVWASLPMSLTQAPADNRLVAVDGQAAEWIDTLTSTIRAGVSGVLLVRPAAGPSAPDIRAAAKAAADVGTIVAVQSAWAANPAVAQFAQAATGQLSDLTLIDSVIQLGGTEHRRWDDVLLGQLTLLRAVTGPLGLTRFTAQHENGYTLDGAAGTSAVTLAAVQSAPATDTARLAAYGATGDGHLIVPADGVARAAAAWFVNPDGAMCQPTWYETASRASWTRLHHAATERPCGPLPDLADLADDFELLAGITARWQGRRS